jgi:hypothetical protein
MLLYKALLIATVAGSSQEGGDDIKITMTNAVSPDTSPEKSNLQLPPNHRKTSFNEFRTAQLAREQNRRNCFATIFLKIVF